MKTLSMLMLMLLLSACDSPDDLPTHSAEGYRIHRYYHKTCVEGVVYYNAGNKLAPAYRRDGTIELCEMR